jgi:hypothetical protein
MKINKTEIIEDLKVRCTFDNQHGSCSTMYYVESILDGSILHVGHGNANIEMSEKEMIEYTIRVGLDVIKMSRYNEHGEDCKTSLQKAIGILENVASNDSVFREACLFMEGLKNGNSNS